MASQSFLSGKVDLHCGDCLDVLKAMPDAVFDSVVTDPPYALVSITKRYGGSPLDSTTDSNAQRGRDGKEPYGRVLRGFMGKQWDTGDRAFAVEFWVEVYRVLKPGGHIAAFSGTRTYHRLAVAIEDAGFDVRDMLSWNFGSGFPKNHDIGKKLDAYSRRCSCGRQAQAVTIQQASDGSLCGVRQDEGDAASVASEGEAPDVLTTVQRRSSRRRMGETWPQGNPGQEDVHGDVWPKEPGMEGRGDLSQATRELRVGEVREMPAGVALHGEIGRVCDGASGGYGADGSAPADANGMRASSRPQSVEQLPNEPGTLAGQQKSQDGGAWPHCGRCGKPMVPGGLGTALKPAHEPICLARKPLIGTVAENVLQHGTGAINIDGCRVEAEKPTGWGGAAGLGYHGGCDPEGGDARPVDGRWPANIIHDGSEEVLAAFPETRSGQLKSEHINRTKVSVYGAPTQGASQSEYGNVSGSAARFFYTAKADAEDRLGSKHPTVKPLDLMQWLVRLITPKGGLVLDPFAGTGTTGEAAWREGMRCVLIEREEEYQADIARRMDLAEKPAKRAATAAAKGTLLGAEGTPLFDVGEGA